MAEDIGSVRSRTPISWPTEPEPIYADCQEGLAIECDVHVRSRTVHTEDHGRLHYLEAGDPEGEPVVLLHGITEPAATWIPMMPALADDYRIVAPDMPGEGLSEKTRYRGRTLREDLTAYLVTLFDRIDLDRPHVVGHSLGGGTAFLLALDHDRVDRLCLVGAPAGVSREFPLLVRLFTIHGVGRVLFWLSTMGDEEAYARKWLNRFGVVDDAAVPEAFYRTYAARLDLPGLRSSMRSLFYAAGSFGRMHELTDISEEIAGIDRPTSFVWGSEDYYWEPSIGRELAGRMPDAEFHELPNHGHTPWLEPGDEAERLVRSFLGG